MSQTQKTAALIAVFALTVLIFIVFVIVPLFNEAKKSSQDILVQKNILAEFETKTKNIQKYHGQEQALAEIGTLFVNQAEPINFIEFLERTASQSQLYITISPLARTKAEEDPWPSMNFQLTLTGSFSDFLRFLEKLELSHYLVEVSDLNIITGKLKGLSAGGINASFSIKVYSK